MKKLYTGKYIRILHSYTIVIKLTNLFKQRLTPLLAVPKIKHFCSYQERSHYEVKEKLYALGLNKVEVETLISQLIEEDYLNEQRFAEHFVGGKFRQKHWGKIKIKYELNQKRVSEYNIKKALALIPINDYKNTLLKLATTKWNSLKKEQYMNREVKTTNYLLQKGYEHNFIKEAIQQLKEK